MDSHTLIQALIYLGSAALIVPIAVRLGLGSVLGYLIAGCIIGPWGLRLVTDAESILHFAEIGVVLMLFIIGLELDPQRLWKLRAAVFGCGALQMVICGGLLGLFCMLLGLRWQVAELIGMTLALSSTAIAMQAMNERNLMVTQMGRSATRRSLRLRVLECWLTPQSTVDAIALIPAILFRALRRTVHPPAHHQAADVTVRTP